jgi:hypothetical protein
VGRAPEADSSVKAAVVSRETTGAAAASSPPDASPALALLGPCFVAEGPAGRNSFG